MDKISALSSFNLVSDNLQIECQKMTKQLRIREWFYVKEIHKDYWAKGFDMYKMIYEEN